MRGKAALGLALGVAAALLPSSPPVRAADNWPSRPIHIIVPYPAGGIVDIVARAVTEQVGRDTRQAVVVEARPGANSNIGTSAVARSEPDGYTWLVTGPAVLVNPSLYKDAGWDAMKDFKCVGLAVWNQSVALVHPSMPVKTHRRIRRAGAHKTRPAQFRQSRHRLVDRSDRAKAVPGRRHQARQYRLQGPAAGADRPDDQPDAFRDRVAGAGLPHIKEGTVKPLAVFTEKRVADLPDVPTIAEAGYAEAAYVPWYGIYVPSSTPDELVGKIHAAINKALENPDVQRQLSIADIPGKPMPLPDLANLMRNDREKLVRVVKTAGEALQ